MSYMFVTSGPHPEPLAVLLVQPDVGDGYVVGRPTSRAHSAFTRCWV